MREFRHCPVNQVSVPAQAVTKVIVPAELCLTTNGSWQVVWFLFGPYTPGAILPILWVCWPHKVLKRNTLYIKYYFCLWILIQYWTFSRLSCDNQRLKNYYCLLILIQYWTFSTLSCDNQRLQNYHTTNIYKVDTYITIFFIVGDNQTIFFIMHQ